MVAAVRVCEISVAVKSKWWVAFRRQTAIDLAQA